MKRFLAKRKNVLLVVGVALLMGVPLWLNQARVKTDNPLDPPPPAEDEAGRLIQKASENYFYRDYPLAAENYRKAIAIFESRKDFPRAAKTYESLGDLYKASRDSGEAERNYLTAADYHERNRDITGQARAFKEIGDLRLRENVPDRAIEWYRKALNLANQAGPSLVLARINESLGHVYWDMDIMPQAIEHFALARDAFAAINHPLGYEHMERILDRLRGQPPRPRALRPGELQKPEDPR
jgi:tetratricopeptide (TPR) repeat protein